MKRRLSAVRPEDLRRIGIHDGPVHLFIRGILPPGERRGAVAFDDIHALVRRIRVQGILDPVFVQGRRGIVHMIDHQAASADKAVPFLIGAAFDEEDLPLLVCGNQVIIPVFMDRRQGVLPFLERLGLGHFKVPALQAAVVRRRLAVIVLVAGVHQVDFRPDAFRIPVILIIRIIQVRNAESMGILMAEGSDGRIDAILDFRGAGVVVDQFPVQAERLPGPVPDIPLVGPDPAVMPLAAVTGIKDEHIVHLAVRVVVIFGKIHLVVHQLAGLHDHLFRRGAESVKPKCKRRCIFLNQKTGSMVLYDRTTGDNANAMVFGHSGSGKSFFTKMEMLQVLLTRQDAQVFVIDPQGEYAPLAKELNGAEINIKLGSKHYLNPLDLDISSDGEDEVDPVTMKSDYVKSLVQIMGNRQLTAPEWGILDKCVRQIYKPYIDELIRTGKTCDKAKCPQLTDLYTALNLQRKDFPEAGSVADMIKQYTVGSFDTFAHRTNIKDESRFIVYNIKNLGTNMKELGLFICLNQAFNQMIYNSSRGIHTFLYLDEFHLLLESPDTTVFVKRVWKMARKWLGVTMCMQQNTEDLLRNADTRNIVNNTSFVVMLSVPEMDRQNLQELFPLSDDQLEYITNKEKGHGLIFNGSVVVPFGFKFPKNTQIYKMLTTSHDVEGAMYA